jgi:hypothetical protein
LRATRKRIGKISFAARAIASRVGTTPDEVKLGRKLGEEDSPAART